jgi:hypothetical protein
MPAERPASKRKRDGSWRDRPALVAVVIGTATEVGKT